ncbi:MAG: ribonucleoside-triphosphate reductase, partial [bacterium]|nr:ribonucleoside-triphosphate reductase [bacterium]
IPESTAITCVKPEGNSSQLRDSSSGIHPRYSKYYIRTNRGNKVDPTTQFLKDQGVPCEDDVTNPHVYVFSFPQEAPNGGKYRDDISALAQLELWLSYNEWWCEHKPSITVYVRPNEWLEVGAFVYKHFDKMSGISFLPFTDHSYRQAPYQEITKEEYDKLVEKMPKILDLSQLEKYETTDQTTSTREFACTGAQSCELV